MKQKHITHFFRCSMAWWLLFSMGEPEQLLAEPDEVEEEEPVEGVHPPDLQQTSPRLIAYIINQGKLQHRPEFRVDAIWETVVLPGVLDKSWVEEAPRSSIIIIIHLTSLSYFCNKVTLSTTIHQLFLSSAASSLLLIPSGSSTHFLQFIFNLPVDNSIPGSEQAV